MEGRLPRRACSLPDDSGTPKSVASSGAANSALALLKLRAAIRWVSIRESSAPSSVLSAATRDATWVKSSGTDSRTRPFARDGSETSSSIVANDGGVLGVTGCGSWYDIEDPQHRKIPATPHSSDVLLSNDNAAVRSGLNADQPEATRFRKRRSGTGIWRSFGGREVCLCNFCTLCENLPSTLADSAISPMQCAKSAHCGLEDAVGRGTSSLLARSRPARNRSSWFGV